MIVYYNPDTMTPYHVVEHYPDTYTPNANEHWFVQEQAIPFFEMRLVNTDQGIRALRRDPAPVINAPASLRVGVEATFTGVPEGTSVIVNGATLGVMDASGALEFTPQTAGTYVFRFESATAMPKEITLEALS